MKTFCFKRKGHKAEVMGGGRGKENDRDGMILKYIASV
jgi:hypothetical protein